MEPGGFLVALSSIVGHANSRDFEDETRTSLQLFPDLHARSKDSA